MGNYKITFDHVFFSNRWRKPDYSREGSWVIIGVQKRWFSPEDFCYRFCFFGFDVAVWFKRKFIDL